MKAPVSDHHSTSGQSPTSSSSAKGISYYGPNHASRLLQRQQINQSPQVKQQKRMQAMINQSPQVLQAKMRQNAITERQKNPIQRKINSMETKQGTQWYDDERIDLGFFPTKEKLVEVLRKNVTVPVFDLSGKSMERIEELYGTKIYSRKSGPFVFNLTQDNANGANRIEVNVDGETDPVGYANFTIEQWPTLGDPGQDEDYSKAHVLGRTDKVSHLTGIYNLSMTRDGPADIYNGFGRQLLHMVEMKSIAHGAGLIYLEPANAAVRTDPNTNEKQMISPTGFYQKYGYGFDGAAMGHNWVRSIAEAEGFGLDMAQQVKYAQRQVAVKLEGTLSKALGG